MAVVLLERTQLPFWELPTDPYNREQRNAAHQALEDRVVVFARGTLAARPAAGTIARVYEVVGDTDDNNGRRYWDTGTAWLEIQPVGGRVATSVRGPLADGVAGRGGSFWRGDTGDGGYTRVDFGVDRTAAGNSTADTRWRLRRVDRPGPGADGVGEVEQAVLDLVPGAVKVTGARLHVDRTGKGNTGNPDLRIDRDPAETNDAVYIKRSDVANPILRILPDGGRTVMRPTNMGEALDAAWNTDVINARNALNSVEHVGAFHRRTAGNTHGSLQYRFGRMVDGAWYDRLEFRHDELAVEGANLKVADGYSVFASRMRATQAYSDVLESTTSGSYVALTTAVNVSFTAPASGVVLIFVQANAYNNSSAESWVGFDLVRQSDNVVIGGAQDGNAGATAGSFMGTAHAIVFWNGLAPGTVYEVRQKYRTSGGTTGNFRARRTVVLPSL